MKRQSIKISTSATWRWRRALRVAGLLTILTLPTSLATAQVIDIDGPEIKQGEREVKLLNTINGRYRAGATGNPRSSHELNAGYSPLDYFKLSAHIDFENVAGEDFRVEHATAKSFIELLEAGDKGGLGLGWHTALQGGIHRGATNSVVFGPIIKVGAESFAVSLNPYVEKTFGRNHEPGVAFIYGWQAKIDIREGFAIGVEGVGRVDDIGNAPPWSEQDHRIGPALFFEWPVGGSRSVLLDVAALAGLTEATPTASLKLNVGTKF